MFELFTSVELHVFSMDYVGLSSGETLRALSALLSSTQDDEEEEEDCGVRSKNTDAER